MELFENPYHKPIMYIMHGLHWLHKNDMIGGGGMKTTPKGEEVVDSLLLAGYRPTAEEIENTVSSIGDIIGMPEGEDRELIVRLLVNLDELKEKSRNKGGRDEGRGQ